MNKRTPFPPVFWVSNTVEIFERFAYYGIFMGFGIYMENLRFSDTQIGFVQSLFLMLSYLIPIISGTFADRFGFKKMLLISYLIYLPAILSLLVTHTYSGILLAMSGIGFAAGSFKPLVMATIRSVTDRTNKTLAFGIFYQMVNIGASLGPVLLGKLRVISYQYSFVIAAAAIGVMFLVTLFFYKEPSREIQGETLGKKVRELGMVLSDYKFLMFLVLIGLFFWLPLWAFFELLARYVNFNIDNTILYNNIKNVLGSGVANFISEVDKNGVRHILGETIAHDGYVIIIFQILISTISEKFKPLSSFITGLIITASGFVFLGLAGVWYPSLVFLGILLFAIGEMICSPRIQEYIGWIAPKEKAGLYLGANNLAVCLGAALSGVIYNWLFGFFKSISHGEYVWYTLAAHCLVGAAVIFIFTKTLGEFKEMEE
jgi:proton-dependent oligopeptide transporter, POT family